MNRKIKVGFLLSCLSLGSVNSFAQVAGTSSSQPSTTGTGAPSGAAADTQQPNATPGVSSGHEGRTDSAKGPADETVSVARTQRSKNNPECTEEQMRKSPKKCDPKQKTKAIRSSETK